MGPANGGGGPLQFVHELEALRQLCRVEMISSESSALVVDRIDGAFGSRDSGIFSQRFVFEISPSSVNPSKVFCPLGLFSVFCWVNEIFKQCCSLINNQPIFWLQGANCRGDNPIAVVDCGGKHRGLLTQRLILPVYFNSWRARTACVYSIRNMTGQ